MIVCYYFLAYICRYVHWYYAIVFSLSYVATCILIAYMRIDILRTSAEGSFIASLISVVYVS